MSDAAPISTDRRPLSRLLGLLALLAVLCLPAAHALHLRLANAEHATLAVDDHDVATHDHDGHGDHSHGDGRPGHDAAHCSICVAVQSINSGAALFDAAIASAFDAPAAFPAVLYVAPPADAFVPTVAVPRGPPARA